MTANSTCTFCRVARGPEDSPRQIILCADHANSISVASLRAAIFTVLDAGDPERGGDPWLLDAVMAVTVEDATENRWRFVEQITERLKGKQQ